MKAFTYRVASSEENAGKILSENAEKSLPLAGGTSLLNLMKNYVLQPEVLVNIKKIPGTGLAYHPYTLAGGPDVPTPNPGDASIGELSRVIRTLDRLSKAKRLVSHRMPLWITEFGFQTDPPDPYQSPIRKAS